MRQLSLSFGVYANNIARDEKFSIEPLKKAIRSMIDQKVVKNDTKIVVIAGSFGINHGASYIEISTAANLISKSH